jgi:pimeloyl-ACP methyl ester carboxylesterase
MHRRAVLSGVAAGLAGCTVLPKTSPAVLPSEAARAVVPANPRMGFHFPYVLQQPDSGVAKLPFLLVEPNNSGHVSTKFEDHLQSAIELARVGLGGSVAKKLDAALLMPVFPRGPDLYTHSLGRATMLAADPALRRLDLQVLAMMQDAQTKLSEQGNPLQAQVLLCGFSASAMFVTRFAAMHPTTVRAVAAGGLNGFVILPLPRLGTADLDFPLGIGDLSAIAGQRFDAASWKRVPQFLFMGAADTNDAVEFDDAYSLRDRTIIHDSIGRNMMPDRWRQCEKIYAQAGARATFITYPDLGHGTNGRVHADVAEFLRQAIA